MRKLSASVLLLFLLLSASAAHAATAEAHLPFIEDDCAKALSEATQRKLPVFVDVWAPW